VGCPKARVVTIGECASHVPVAAAIGLVISEGSGEQSLARGLAGGWRRAGC
jgi:ABC-type protease/lipase transport system fused ATPase/permease subunit